MLRKLQQMALAAVAAVSFISCAPDGADYVDELDIVYTNYSEDYDFKSKNTFALPTKIPKITGLQTTNTEVQFLDEQYSQILLREIKDNLEFLGYTEVNALDEPDFIILPAVIQTDNLNFYYDWGYWNWFYPGWNWGWGWYYPGYYPPVVTNVRSGTLMMQMTVPSEIDASDKIPVVWTGVVNGLLEGSENSIATRAKSTIDQAFKQSTYLAK